MISFWGAYSKGYQRANQDHEADYTAHYAAERDYEKCRSKTSINEAVECAKQADKAYRDNTRADQDLNAQREMADWAESMLWATSLLGVASLIIGGVGVYFVHKTLEATRGATDAAVDNAKAAAISMKMMERQVRPYLYFESSIGEISRKANGFRASGEITFKNSGVTPAIVVYNEIMTFSIVDEKPRSIAGTSGGTRQILGPSKTINFPVSGGIESSEIDPEQKIWIKLYVGCRFAYGVDGKDEWIEDTWLLAFCELSNIVGEGGKLKFELVPPPKDVPGVSLTEYKWWEKTEQT